MADRARNKRRKKFGYDGCMKSYWHSAKSGFGADGNTNDRGGRERSRSPQQRFNQYENKNNNSWGSNNNTQNRGGNTSWGNNGATNNNSSWQGNNDNNRWGGQAQNSYSNGQSQQPQNSWGGQPQQTNSWGQQPAQREFETHYSGQNSNNTSFQAQPAQSYGGDRNQYRGSNGPVPAESYRSLTPADQNGHTRYEDLVKKTAPMPYGGMMGPQQGYPLTNAAQKPHLKALDGNSMNPLTGNSNPMSAHKLGSSQGSGGYPSGNKAGVTGPSNPMSSGSKPITNPGNPMALNGGKPMDSMNTGNTIVYKDFRDGFDRPKPVGYAGPPAPMNGGYRGGSLSNSYDTMANNLMNVYSKENPEIIKMNPPAGGEMGGPPKLGDLGMSGGY